MEDFYNYFTNKYWLYKKWKTKLTQERKTNLLLRNGMQLQCGSGKENKMPVLSVEIISWTFVLNAKHPKKKEVQRIVMLLGDRVTMPSISIVSQDGLRRGRRAH